MLYIQCPKYKHFFLIVDNPLTCGCDMAWIMNNTDYLSRLTKHAATCADGTQVSDLQPDNFVVCN